MVFHGSLSDSKSLQVSRTLPSILTDLNNEEAWMVSTRPVISNFSSINPLVTVPRAPITIGIIVTFQFNSFFNSQARSRYLSFFFTFFQFYTVVSPDSKVHNSVSSLFLLNYYKVWSSG